MTHLDLVSRWNPDLLDRCRYRVDHARGGCCWVVQRVHCLQASRPFVGDRINSKLADFEKYFSRLKTTNNKTKQKKTSQFFFGQFQNQKYKSWDKYRYVMIITLFLLPEIFVDVLLFVVFDTPTVGAKSHCAVHGTSTVEGLRSWLRCLHQSLHLTELDDSFFVNCSLNFLGIQPFKTWVLFDSFAWFQKFVDLTEGSGELARNT